MSWILASSPDGALIAFTHQPTPDADTWPETRLAIILTNDSADSPTDVAHVAVDGACPSFLAERQLAGLRDSRATASLGRRRPGRPVSTL